MCLPALAVVGTMLGASAASAATVGTIATGATALGVAGAGVAAYGQYQAGKSQKAMYNYESQEQTMQANYDISTGEAQAQNIEGVGAEQGRQLVQRQAQTEGTQKAAEGAAGTGGSVTAQNIAVSTMNKEQLDQQMLRYNTDIKSWSAQTQGEEEAWGANTTAGQYSLAATNAQVGANYNVAGSLLGGATSIANTALRIQ